MKRGRKRSCPGEPRTKLAGRISALEQHTWGGAPRLFQSQGCYRNPMGADPPCRGAVCKGGDTDACVHPGNWKDIKRKVQIRVCKAQDPMEKLKQKHPCSCLSKRTFSIPEEHLNLCTCYFYNRMGLHLGPWFKLLRRSTFFPDILLVTVLGVNGISFPRAQKNVSVMG